MRRNPGLRIGEYDTAGPVNEGIVKVCRMDLVRNGFSFTGIFPLNGNVFSAFTMTEIPKPTDIETVRSEGGFSGVRSPSAQSG
jgi:hypothetical protein